MILNANALHIPLADNSIDCVVTSPPYYGLRDYNIPDQLGLEPTPEEYIANMVAVFREVRRVLKPAGTAWVNLGDSYSGSKKGVMSDGSYVAGKKQSSHRAWEPDRGKRNLPRWGSGNTAISNLAPKQLVGIPWRVALALQADGWWLRSDIIWSKLNPMPESVRDRPTKSHEYVFLLSKSSSYYFDQEAVRERLSESTAKDPHMSDMGRQYKGKGRGAYGESGKANGAMEAWSLNPSGRNIRSVWTIATQPTSEAHFATYPQKLVEPCIKAGTSERGVCPVCGAAWERVVEKTGKFQRRWSTNNAEGSPYNNQDSFQNTYATVGWQPACTCEVPAPDGSRVLVIPDPVPAIVLDPFCGSGTTGIVAKILGRRFIGLDLSWQYLSTIARKRLGMTALDEWVNGKKPQGKSDSQYQDLPIFGG